MLHLLSCLEGEPKDLIAHYPPTSDSYGCALDPLELLYGGRRRLMSEAIQNVRQGRVTDEENVRDVKRFLAVLEGNRTSSGAHRRRRFTRMREGSYAKGFPSRIYEMDNGNVY